MWVGRGSADSEDSSVWVLCYRQNSHQNRDIATVPDKGEQVIRGWEERCHTQGGHVPGILM